MKSGKKLYKVKMEKLVLKSIARNIGNMEALFPVDNSKVYARVLLRSEQKKPKKTGQVQKLAIDKKSTIFVQSL